MDGVNDTPGVGNFVFEKATSEWEDAVEGLGDLKEGMVIEGFGVEGDG